MLVQLDNRVVAHEIHLSPPLHFLSDGWGRCVIWLSDEVTDVLSVEIFPLKFSCSTCYFQLNLFLFLFRFFRQIVDSMRSEPKLGHFCPRLVAVKLN